MAEAGAALSAARARIAGGKSPLARLARLGKVARPGDGAADLAADFNACLARISEGKGDTFSNPRNL